jgi:Na+-driven multidrug efflux pump
MPKRSLLVISTCLYHSSAFLGWPRSSGNYNIGQQPSSSSCSPRLQNVYNYKPNKRPHLDQSSDQDNQLSSNDRNHYSSEVKTSIGSSILSLAVPALVTLAIDPLMSLTDTILVGRSSSVLVDGDSLVTSSIPLASIGSASALLTFTFYLFNFLSTVVTPLVSQQRASGQTAKALQTSSRALSFAIALGILLCILLQLTATPLLHTVFSTESSMGPLGDAYAQTFVKIRALASPAIFIASAATGVLRGYALDGKTSLVVVGVANVINFLLDLILIPSYQVKLGPLDSSTNTILHLGFGLGPTGAAISTTLAEWLSALAFLGVLGGILPSADTRGDDEGITEALEMRQRKPGLGSNQIPLYNGTKTIIWPCLEIPPWSDVQPLIVASSSVFTRSLVLQIILAGAAAMAARTGSTGSIFSSLDHTVLPWLNHPEPSSSSLTSISSSASIAAHQIALQLWFLCSFVCDALAAASQTLVADAMGRQDPKDTREISKRVFLYSLVLGLILGFALKVMSVSADSMDGFLITSFTQDRPTQQALIPILGIVSAAQPLNSFVFAADGVLQGASEFRFQAWGMALSVFMAILAYVGLELWGDGSNSLVHVWDALVVLQVMRAVTSLYKLVDPKGPIDLFGA